MAKKQKKSFFKIVSGRFAGIILIAASLFALLACIFYNHSDAAINIISDRPVQNKLGFAGASVADYLISGFGLAVPLFLPALILWGWDLLRGRGIINFYSRLLAWFWGVSFTAITLAFLPFKLPDIKLGGLFGTFFAGHIRSIFNHFYSYGHSTLILMTICFALAFIAFDYALGITVKHWYKLSKTVILGIYAGIQAVIAFFARFRRIRKPIRPLTSGTVKTKQAKTPRKKSKEIERIEPTFAADDKTEEPDVMPAPQMPTVEKAQKKAKQQIQSASDGYTCPDINLLSRPKEKSSNNVSKDELEKIARDLENTLQEFGVNGKIVKVRPGPVVTLYELEPAPGTKSARVIGLADDIARSMSAAAVRIAVVAGSNTIGIELPNIKRDTVWLRDLFEDSDFTQSKNDLNVVLGKDIGGRNVYADLAKMPHLLVAGTTGSGKSVGVNSMILSLLFRMSPEECKLIMIDPKMLEFSMYNGIPHLLTPVITDPAKAVIGLKWAVREMEDRYRAMAQMNVRNIAGYNQKVAELKAQNKEYKRTVQTGFDDNGCPVYEEQVMDLKPLPYIVIVVDEMADLMLVAGKEVEAAIQRLAQMARAAGLHLIMSTQRPSVDVITGTIKANFPTRISFQVTSKIDSRTILGEQGAEQLLGKGDMLYMPAGQRPIRIHGAFVKDSEVEGIVEFIKSQKAPEYIEEVTQGELNTSKDSGAVFDKGSFGGGGNEEDLYAQAIDIIRNDKKASTSYIQRKLRIGYNRAASLIDRMEDEGIVSAPDHTGRRQVIG